MPTIAEVILDSYSEENNARLITLKIVFPRTVLSQFNTHCSIAKNFQSTRAIPLVKQIEAVETDPFFPTYYTGAQKGMVGADKSGEEEWQKEAHEISRDNLLATIEWVKDLDKHGVHKQDAGRYLEPWMWECGIVSSTNWNNYLWLRTADDVYPPHRELAMEIGRAIMKSTPTYLGVKEWHIPMLSEDEMGSEAFSLHGRLCMSVARIARVSYLRQDVKTTLLEDEARHNDLSHSGHWSPFEHQAQVIGNGGESRGKFKGFRQYRHDFMSENFDPRVREGAVSSIIGDRINKYFERECGV